MLHRVKLYAFNYMLTKLCMKMCILYLLAKTWILYILQKAL